MRYYRVPRQACQLPQGPVRPGQEWWSMAMSKTTGNGKEFLSLHSVRSGPNMTVECLGGKNTITVPFVEDARYDEPW